MNEEDGGTSGSVRRLISARPGPRPFDPHPDGDRVVVRGELAGRANVDQVVLVSHFLDEVRRLSEARR